MSKIKVKEWFKEHKKEIVITAVSLTVGAIGGTYLYKYSKRDRDKFNEGLVSIYSTLHPALKGSNGAYMFYPDGSETNTVKDCPKIINDLLEQEFVELNREITGIVVFKKSNK